MAEALEVRTIDAGNETRMYFGAFAVVAVVLFGLGYLVVGSGEVAESVLSEILGRVISAGVGSLGMVFTAYSVSTAIDKPMWRRILLAGLGILVSTGLWWGYLASPRVRSTVVGSLVAIAVSAAIFVGANAWFNSVTTNWPWFQVITGAIVTGFVALVLVGNRAVGLYPSGEEGTSFSWAVVLIVAALGGATSWRLAATEAGPTRLATGAVGGALVGLILGLFFRSGAFPAMRIVPLIVWPVVLGLIGAGLAVARKRPIVPAVITGATIGWLVGAWLVPSIPGGTVIEAIAGTTVLGLGIGTRLGIGRVATYSQRLEIERRARAAIFLVPALLFIAISLVIPTIKTILLSFGGPRGDTWVGFANFVTVVRDRTAVDVSGWMGIFSSSLFWWAIGLGVLGAVMGIRAGREVGRGFVATGLSAGPIAIAVLLFAFALFTNLRGTFFNNLWWVFTVTIIATTAGLAIAVLADRAANENLAKSIIFMPMAVSFVGATLIWRGVYVSRPGTQSGPLNAIWVGLGNISTSSTGRVVAAVVLGLIGAGFVWLALQARRAGSNGLLAGSVVVATALGWLIYRFLGPGLGGIEQTIGEERFERTILFIQDQPFNNVWLMVILIWIQAGFTMVIFSAAIKAVPGELIEASMVDGATESQTFWRVTVPQIAPTIGVVVTTLIVLVMKVFDIVKVMTNGNFGTQVLANLMWNRAFGEFNLGLGSAIAVVLFLSVLPVMYINIRRIQQEAA